MEMKFTGICLITNSVPVLTKFYTKVLGVEAEGDDVHTELKTEGRTYPYFQQKGWKAWLHSPGNSKKLLLAHLII
jgi:hypothetical protein